MKVQDYMEAVGSGVGSFGVEWTTSPKPAAAHRAHTLTKVTTAVVLTGVGYADLAENSERETGELPWGEWVSYPFHIRHRETDYVRVNTVDGTLKTTYYVDGFDVDRDAFLAYLTPSQRESKRPVGGTLTIKAENMRIVASPAMALA